MRRSKFPKTRADAKLATLSEERQAEIAHFCRNHTLLEVVEWLSNSEQPLKVSQMTVSNWLSGWHLRQQYRATESDMAVMVSLLERKLPKMSAEERDQYAAQFFQLQALKNGDGKMFLDFRAQQHREEIDKAMLAQRERQLALDIQKFQFDAVKAAMREVEFITTVKADSSINEAQKIDAIRTKLFGTLPLPQSQS